MIATIVHDAMTSHVRRVRVSLAMGTRARARIMEVGLLREEEGVAAVVVRPGFTVEAGELQDAVRQALRGSKTPDRIVFRDALPHTETGKLLRRVVLTELTERS